MKYTKLAKIRIARDYRLLLNGLLAVIWLAVVYLIGLKALDTGSLLQYGLVIVALILGVRSVVTTINTCFHKVKA